MENKNKNRKSHKLLKIFLFLLLAVVLVIAALAIWQKDNINAFIKAQNTTQEDIAAEISVSKANTQKEIEKFNIPIKRDFSLEEEEEIRKGTLSVEEAVKRIMTTNPQGEETNENQNGTTATDNNKSEAFLHTEDEPELTGEQQIVAKYLTEMYTLKAYYIGQLGSFERELKAEYKKQNGNNKNAASIAKFVQSNMGKAISLETECDNKVEGILTNMQNELEAIGADTSIVQIAEDSYMNEKSLRKSYYLSLYN